MKISYKSAPTPPPEISIIELNAAEHGLLVEELTRLNGWTSSSHPTLHRMWLALRSRNTLP